MINWRITNHSNNFIKQLYIPGYNRFSALILNIIGVKSKMNGKVKFFNESKGFGFIQSDDGKEYFVHLSGLKEGVRLRDNDSVSFDVEEGDRGPKAVNVSLDTE